ncbi:MAG: hypothetical protein ACI87O_000401 [Planctomycetota bacterium]|jgi:hypothetical protein
MESKQIGCHDLGPARSALGGVDVGLSSGQVTGVCALWWPWSFVLAYSNLIMRLIPTLACP